MNRNWLHVSLICLSISLFGCDRNREPAPITEVRPAPEPSVPIDPELSDARRFGYPENPMEVAESPTQSPQAAELAWETPPGWREIEPTEFRNPNFAVERHPQIQAYVTVLEGEGGGLAANINRWRRQMNLEPVSPEEAIDQLPIEFLDSPGLIVQLDGVYQGMGEDHIDPASMMGVLTISHGRLVTFKAVGPSEAIVDERENILSLAISMHWETGISPHGMGDLPPGHPEIAAQPADPAQPLDPAQLEWTLPEGWTPGPERAMRLVNLKVGDEGECYITLLQGDAGGIAANFNRWRTQMGLEPVAPEEFEQLETLEVLGQPSPLIELQGNYQGMGDASLDQAAMLGLICPLGQQSLFIKLICLQENLPEQREKFREFCLSLRRQ